MLIWVNMFTFWPVLIQNCIDKWGVGGEKGCAKRGEAGKMGVILVCKWGETRGKGVFLGRIANHLCAHGIWGRLLGVVVRLSVKCCRKGG